MTHSVSSDERATRGRSRMAGSAHHSYRRKFDRRKADRAAVARETAPLAAKSLTGVAATRDSRGTIARRSRRRLLVHKTVRTDGSRTAIRYSLSLSLSQQNRRDGTGVPKRVSFGRRRFARGQSYAQAARRDVTPGVADHD